MTRISPKASADAGPEVVVRRGMVPATRPATRLGLVWVISRPAAMACGLVKGESGPSIRLEVFVGVPVQGGEAGLTARVLDGDRAAPLATPEQNGTWIEDSMRGVWHLDIADLLKLTIRRTGDSVEALYARTELLGRAGVLGGRYEFEGAFLERGDHQG